VAELADALGLGSSGLPWGFESPLSHTSAGEKPGRDYQAVEKPLFVTLSRIGTGGTGVSLVLRRLKPAATEDHFFTATQDKNLKR
jgi:hypothetical protein